MNFYPKSLNSIKDLEREKKRLQKQLEQLNSEELFSMKEIMAEASKAKAEFTSGGVVGNILNYIPGSGPIKDIAVNFIKSRLNRPKAAASNTVVNSSVGDSDPSFLSKAKTVAKNGAIEVVTGYLKWKALELSYKGAKYLIHKQQEKAKLKKANK